MNGPLLLCQSDFQQNYLRRREYSLEITLSKMDKFQLEQFWISMYLYKLTTFYCVSFIPHPCDRMIVKIYIVLICFKMDTLNLSKGSNLRKLYVKPLQAVTFFILFNWLSNNLINLPLKVFNNLKIIKSLDFFFKDKKYLITLKCYL